MFYKEQKYMSIDIYFDENYGKLYEEKENGKAEVYIFKTKEGRIVNQFIKREIPITISGEKYYDIITPYGYGGPIIEKCERRQARTTKKL